MKTKVLTLLILMVFFIACSREEPTMVNNDRATAPQIPDEFVISKDSALQHAAAHLFNTDKNIDSQILRKQAPKRTIKIRKLKSANFEQDANVYIFNFEDNNGFAIASADKRDGIAVYASAQMGNLS